MVPAPTFTRRPTSESPRYERWLALEPAPRRLALTSTKFPTCTSSARLAPGRSRANGPTRQRSPSSASSRCEKASRSEEHTSELQSPCNLVCRLLLEKKKNNNTNQTLCHMHQN